ncbi:MAG: trimethylamine methyltransferase family protein [Candidatus Limnocylindrales bacterium]
MHVASLRVLSEIGMDFLDPDARELLRAAGAQTSPDDQRVRFDPDMVLDTIKTAPATFTLHARNPEHHLQIGGDWMAFGTVGSPPNVADLDRGRRIGNRDDYQNLLRLAQSLNPVHFLAGYPVEPVDLHHSVRHLHASLDALTLTDKVIHCYSLGRQRNVDVLEMVRIARGVDDATLDRGAVRLHGRQLRARRCAWIRRCSRGSWPSRRATRPCASPRSRCPVRWPP